MSKDKREKAEIGYNAFVSEWIQCMYIYQIESEMMSTTPESTFSRFITGIIHSKQRKPIKVNEFQHFMKCVVKLSNVKCSLH